MALNSRLDFKFAATLTGTGDLAIPTSTVDYQKAISYANGTGASQADLIWHDQRTLAGAAADNLDIVAVLAGIFGGTLTIVKLKGLILYSLPANTTVLTLSREAAGVPYFSAVGDAMVIQPGGLFCTMWPAAAGIAVTPTTADLITITNGPVTPATYDIIVLGTSA